MSPFASVRRKAHGAEVMTTSTARRPVVLVVDDEEPIRKVARRVLESGGYEVLDASNGLEALQQIDKGTKIDLLMADLRMPQLGGSEVARRFCAANPDLKVLYVSGYVDELFQDRPLLWDGEAFLDKPFSPKGLVEAAGLLLTGHVATA
jgi:two-component system, cell cycle sensor histidine kinase and response regulator CckA